MPDYPGKMIRFGVLLILCLLPLLLRAEPVGQSRASQVAKSQLPVYFPGQWKLTDTIKLYNLSDNIVAYAFVFCQKQKFAAESVKNSVPSNFVDDMRARLLKENQLVDSNSKELYGEDLFATILISADDTEPPVLKCYKGLPPQIVKQSDAKGLASKKQGGAWRVGRCLMLGMFDEAFLCEDVNGTDPDIVVEMRSKTVVPKDNVVKKVQSKKKTVQDSARIARCQEAWKQFPLKIQKDLSGSSEKEKPEQGDPPVQVFRIPR